MKKVLLLVVLALIGVAAWYYWETRPKPDNEVAPLQNKMVSKHNGAFNTSADSLLQQYYALAEAFVNWDTVAIRTRTTDMKNSIQQLPLDEFVKDTAIFETARSYKEELTNNLSAISGEADLTAKRRTFHTLSQNMYDLLRTVKHDASAVYVQECPMAFNDNETGLWLSKTAAIRNPYLGLYHPKYKSGMLECGEVRDSITNK